MTSPYPHEIKTSQLTQLFDTINNLNSLEIKKFILTHKKFEDIKNNHKSTLCFKIKKQHIKKTKFGVSINISSKILNEYLKNSNILDIQLNFSLTNLTQEKNLLYILNGNHEKEHTVYFHTQNHINSVNLNHYLYKMQNKISNGEMIHFFIPMFGTYYNYDDFYESIHAMSLDIEYL